LSPIASPAFAEAVADKFGVTFTSTMPTPHGQFLDDVQIGTGTDCSSKSLFTPLGAALGCRDNAAGNRYRPASANGPGPANKGRCDASSEMATAGKIFRALH